MGNFKCRKLVIKRHPEIKHRLVICDEETGEPLDGQTNMVIESPAGDTPKVTVTFEAFGPFGIRFEDDERIKI